MACYKDVHYDQDKFIPIPFQKQILPDTFEREPFEYQSLYTYGARFTRHWREWEYLFFYQVYSNFYSTGKFLSKTFTLLVIPVCRCYRFFSGFMEYPYFPHY